MTEEEAKKKDAAGQAGVAAIWKWSIPQTYNANTLSTHLT